MQATIFPTPFRISDKFLLLLRNGIGMVRNSIGQETLELRTFPKDTWYCARDLLRLTNSSNPGGGAGVEL